ncbi:MAG: hypothetical protein FJX35_06990 [Alphaproteobacteria bacterium]|nr:hypothetical protein [Alphaproteobacteria bacterium]
MTTECGDAALTERPLRAVIELRGAGDDVAACLTAAQLDVPRRPNSACGGERCVMWLGPDTWWVTGSIDREGDLLAALDRGMGRRGSVVVLSDGLASFSLDGAGAADVLARGTSIDLDSAFALESCTRTALGRIWVVLRRTASGFEILVDRSHAGYLQAWFRSMRNEDEESCAPGKGQAFDLSQGGSRPPD